MPPTTRTTYFVLATCFILVAGAAWWYAETRLVQTTNSEQNTQGTYTACGCGCCSGVEPRAQCLYKARGESLEEVIARDRREQSSPSCPYVGCSFPVQYVYCDGQENANVNAATNDNVNASGNVNAALDATADWKIYTNDELGFAIKFPSTWEGYSVGPVINSSIKITHPKKRSQQGNSGEVSFTITRTVRFSALPSSVTIIAKNDTYQYSYTPSYAAAPDEMNTLWEQIDDIIATFTILDETASWKTYTNSKYGFTFKYPPTWNFTEYSYQADQPLSGDGASVSDPARKDGTFSVCPDNRGSDCAPFQDAEWSSVTASVTVDDHIGIKTTYTPKDATACPTCTVRSVIELSSRPSSWKAGRDFRLEDGTSGSTALLEMILYTFTFTK